MDTMGGLALGRPFLLPRFCCRVLVILNLFQDNKRGYVILKQVQDDEKRVGDQDSLA